MALVNSVNMQSFGIVWRQVFSIGTVATYSAKYSASEAYKILELFQYESLSGLEISYTVTTTQLTRHRIICVTSWLDSVITAESVSMLMKLN